MTGTTHRLAGITAGIVVTEVLHIHDVKMQTVIIGGCILGSLLPDIDNPQSTISYKIPFVRIIFGIFQKMIRILSGLLPNKQGNYIRSCIGHRGLTHSLLAVIFLPAISFFITRMIGYSDNLFSISLGIGILSHIILDIFSGGTRLLLPFSAVNIKLMKIRTGGVIEILICFCFSCFLVNWAAEWILNSKL